jgi:mannose-6-phosphate isomerase-like protein (cupin superfamily)
MPYRVFLMWFLILCAVSIDIHAQNELDPRPYDPSVDPDINMFINSWQNSTPFTTHGSLTEWTILTKCGGDPLKPEKKGEVLSYINRLSYAELDAGSSTIPTTLKGEQEIVYCMSGKGNIKTGKKSYELRKGALLVVPEKLEFTVTNTCGVPLTMYLINEPVPPGYKPKKAIEINYENELPLRNEGFITVHWSHNGRKGIGSAVAGYGRLVFDPMTIGQPHSHEPGLEEVWLCTEGKNLAFLGKEICWQYPGTAYRVPPSGFTPHSNINTTEEPVRFLIWIAKKP